MFYLADSSFLLSYLHISLIIQLVSGRHIYLHLHLTMHIEYSSVFKTVAKPEVMSRDMYNRQLGVYLLYSVLSSFFYIEERRSNNIEEKRDMRKDTATHKKT